MRKFTSFPLRLFLTGLATLLPFVVTVLVVGWIVKLADVYVGPSSYFGRLLVSIVGDANKYPGYLIGYLIVTLCIILLGFLVTRATVSRFQKTVNKMFAKIPVFGKIYSAVGQAVEIFGQQGAGAGLEKFGGVGLVTLGNITAIALLTSSQRYVLKDGKSYVLVFVPNSPIPATGFNILAPEENFQKIDMPMEDLIKLTMSLGLLGPQTLCVNPSSGICATSQENDLKE
ncbi:MAG: DUF502 domain-containing protein [Deltaproteobacteria bacterium]|nr:DUF502 domain-containing protein [Deltaproteobacteria bacterium]